MSQPKVEFGWVLAARMPPALREQIDQARRDTAAYLAEQFPDFDWRLPLIERPQPTGEARAEAAELLFTGSDERDLNGWDQALVITDVDLESHYKPYTLGVPSQALAVAVVSTARLLPPTELDADNAPGFRHRLQQVVLHLFGDLHSLPHAEAADCAMCRPEGLDQLDAMQGYDADSRVRLASLLTDVADARVEERPGANRLTGLRFTWQALREGRRDIVAGVGQAHPWEFPWRLGRLTTAALSMLVVLIMTAEVWDLGMNQPPWRVSLLGLLALVGTSGFILARQRLLLRAGRSGLTERNVVTNATTVLVVLAGMATSWLLMFGLALGIGQLFFTDALVAGWAASLPAPAGWREYAVLAGFIASMCIVIGALGASFEGQRYFRHVTFADEEL